MCGLTHLTIVTYEYNKVIIKYFMLQIWYNYKCHDKIIKYFYFMFNKI